MGVPVAQWTEVRTVYSKHYGPISWIKSDYSAFSVNFAFSLKLILI